MGETEVADEKSMGEAANNSVESHGYTPTPSPDHVETGVDSN